MPPAAKKNDLFIGGGQHGVVCADVDQNAASLERLDGVRILANGWQLSGTK